ncbi:MAG TPA: MBL fold metallo-hydrolase [Candidatus Limnocylindria bacterium]|nr:MBL fold metallo-hydrolase [Candidatus Limnocylindria bacterium]
MDAPPLPRIEELSPNLYLLRDTCNVYLVRSGRAGICIDFGSGLILDRLDELGIDHLAAVLMTHHHRDQAQGLPRAVAAGIPIHVPPVERDLFAHVDVHWESREIAKNYNTRQDRFSLVEDVPIAGVHAEYRTATFAGIDVDVLPTPGHTVGSDTILATVDGRRIAFSGDLIAGPGKVWSLAATQWSYNGGEGIGASILSAVSLREREPDVLLPSHGEPMHDPATALDLLIERLGDLRGFRLQAGSPFGTHIEEPFSRITPHLLMNRTSNANSYVLLSESGNALIIDYGYDFSTGLAAGDDRSARRPWLYTVPTLKRDHGVTRIDVAIPTHYHDDHVAGFNLLREVEGTQVWAAENFSDVLEHPMRYDLPCLWFDPIPVDRSLPLDVPVTWEEYQITLHALPGHTHYAVAIEFEVDGKRVMALGDQIHEEGWLAYLFHQEMSLGGKPITSLPPPKVLNYVYQNGFQLGDYRETAELYLRVKPQVLLFGHWPPATSVTTEYLEQLRDRGARLEALHRDLLPLDTFDADAGGTTAVIRPYRSEIGPGELLPLEVACRNPLPGAQDVSIELRVPEGWSVRPARVQARIGPSDWHVAGFEVCAGSGPMRRARVTADLTVGSTMLGEQAEALVTVR